MKKFYLTMSILFVVLLIGSIFLGIITKKSINDDTLLSYHLENKELKLLNYTYPFDENIDPFIPEDDIVEFENIESNSETIIKAKAINPGNRKVYQGCVLTQLEVLKSYKGDLQNKDKIYIFEPIDLTLKPGVIYCPSGYSIIQEGDEYILLLNPLKDTLYTDEEFIYIPSSFTYSKYNCDNRPIKRFEEKELEDIQNSNFYSDVKESAVFLYDKKMYDKYISFYKHVGSSYH